MGKAFQGEHGGEDLHDTGDTVRYGGGIAPVLWADVATVRAATSGRGIQR